MALREVSDEFSQVLYGGNEQILDGLAPKAPPASVLQAVTVSGVCKTAFHQMLAAFEISFGRVGLCDFTSLVQLRLIAVSMDGATSAGAGAILA